MNARRADVTKCRLGIAIGQGDDFMAVPDVQLRDGPCVGMNAAPLWGQGVPGYMWLRVRYLVAVTVVRAADVVARRGGQNLQIYRIECEEVEISRLVKE